MELRSFIAGMLFLFALNNLLPFAGIKLAFISQTPLLNLALGVGALVLAYVLLKIG